MLGFIKRKLVERRGEQARAMAVRVGTRTAEFLLEEDAERQARGYKPALGHLSRAETALRTFFATTSFGPQVQAEMVRIGLDACKERLEQAS